jgi:uncharacterized protein
MADTIYEFDWDETKASLNLRKHGVSFEEVMSVFHDPLNMTRFDHDHSESEERWVTLGQSGHGMLLLVVHTYSVIDAQHVAVRLISARRPTKREAQQYYEA